MPDPIDVRPAPMGYFNLIVRRFGESDALRAAILDGVGITEAELDDPRTEINFTQQMRQLENVNRLFGEGWTLDVPELWRPAAHGALGVAVMTAPTVGAALEVLGKYVPARAPNQRLKLTREAGAYVLRHSVGAQLPDGQHKVVAEGALLSTASMLGMLLGAPRAQLRFDFFWPKPAYGDRLEAALGGLVRWNAGANAVFVPRRLLPLRSPLADPILYEAALERLMQSARLAGAPEGVKGRVESMLQRSDTGRLASAAAARALGLSQRTLVRRLAEVWVSYRDLIDAELKQRARRWLDGGVLSRAEIGERLGFADATGFSRACRRWFRDGA
ncbi:MAG: AraC family transcriptional regulator ligand-binding domain-containing protein [Caulobacteraceae bacterium]